MLVTGKYFHFSLLICFITAGCAVQPEQQPSEQQTVASPPATTSPAARPDLSQLKIGMPRTEAETLLGEPASVMETATGSTEVWVFGTAKNTPQNSSATPDHRGMLHEWGGIAATAVGMVNPVAGLAARLGSSVYDNAGKNSTASSAQQASPAANDSLMVTVEFREDKVFSIQRTRPNIMPAPASK